MKSPMTFEDQDGKAPKTITETMSEDNSERDEAQFETTDSDKVGEQDPIEELSNWLDQQIGDRDTAEGVARRREEAADLERGDEQ